MAKTQTRHAHAGAGACPRESGSKSVTQKLCIYKDSLFRAVLKDGNDFRGALPAAYLPGLSGAAARLQKPGRKDRMTTEFARHLVHGLLSSPPVFIPAVDTQLERGPRC